MNQPITLGIDFGATSIKLGVVQDGRIIKHGNVVPTRQDGKIEPLIRSIVDEIFRLQQGAPRGSGGRLRGAGYYRPCRGRSG